MGIPLCELQLRIDSREFAMYLAYDRIDPHSEERADYRAGSICAVIASAYGSRDSKPADFMPNFDTPEEKIKKKTMSPEHMLHVAMTITKAIGGSVNG